MLGLRDGITALLFDLDGVLTKTADVHAAAWKEMFDGVLAEHDGEPGVDARPFDTKADYHQYVDGKPRYDGVRDFLASRGLHPPEGTADDTAADETIRGLGDRKNIAVQEIIRTKGVEAYAGSVEYLHAARDAGFGIAVVSSSANAEAVLAAAGLSEFITVRIDGKVAADEGITGKPAPDMFLVAAERLGATPDTSAVFEDAISGVRSGAAGHFAMVVGVDRGGQPEALREAGATIVVDDLADLLDPAATPG
ncbi:MAG: beta-phosphoglucomutase family hydrolase [Solirubrobacteraceae bacterium]|nr:beta-phosphoglucomutase family hydrolase [Solirubrobacteraceae bacterium]